MITFVNPEIKKVGCIKYNKVAIFLILKIVRPASATVENIEYKPV